MIVSYYLLLCCSSVSYLLDHVNTFRHNILHSPVLLSCMYLLRGFEFSTYNVHLLLAYHLEFPASFLSYLCMVL